MKVTISKSENILVITKNIYSIGSRDLVLRGYVNLYMPFPISESTEAREMILHVS